MTKRFHFVAEITLTVDDAGTQQTFYFSTLGFATKSTDTPANTVIQEYLEDPGTLRRELFSGARISGPVRPSFGQIVLTNHSGVLDDWIGYGISGGRVVVRYGEQGAAYPAGFTTVYIAYAQSLIVDFDRVRVVLRDRLEKLEEPIVTDVFQGTGRLEGTGIAQKKKQIVFGQPGFIPPVLINQQRQIYFVQLNAADERCFRGTNQPLYTVFEGGSGLNFGGYYASEADLFDGAAPSAGAYKVWAPDVDGLTPESTESAGPLYFRLGSPPEYELRFNALGLLKIAPNEFARRWRFTDLCQRAGVPVTMAAGSYVKSAGNQLIDGDQSYLDVMADACAATFSAFGFTRLDELFTLDLKDPTEGTDTSVFEFNLTNAKDIRRQPVPGGEAPVFQVSCSVGRTWPTSSLRTSLTTEERELFERSPWQATFTGTSASVRRANPGAVSATVEIQGNELRDIADKFAFVRRYIYLYGSRRELITLTTQLTPETMALDLHDKVTLRMPRFGCDDGRDFRIITADLNCRARTVTFGLWGGPPGPLDTILGGGNLSPGGGTGAPVIVSGEGRLDDFVSIFYGRNIGGGGGGSSTLGEWGQFAYGRLIDVCTDGPIWTGITNGTTVGNTSTSLFSLAYQVGRFVRLGRSSATNLQIRHSTDGLTWTSATDVTTGAASVAAVRENPLIAGGGLFFQRVANFEFVKSTDGITFTQVLTGAPSFISIPTMGRYAGGKFFLFNDGNAKFSADLVTFTDCTITGLSGNICGVYEWGGNIYLTTGPASASPNSGRVYKSTDGGLNFSWLSSLTQPWESQGTGPHRFATGPSSVVGIGFNPSTNGPYYTTDGEQWVESGGTTSSILADVLYQKGVFLAIGASNTTASVSADDGATFSNSPNSLPTTGAYCLAGNGDDITIATSPDADAFYRRGLC